jgi:hypothetical protein
MTPRDERDRVAGQILLFDDPHLILPSGGRHCRRKNLSAQVLYMAVLTAIRRPSPFTAFYVLER